MPKAQRAEYAEKKYTKYVEFAENSKYTKYAEYKLIKKMQSIQNMQDMHIREGVKKNRIYLGLCPKLWVGGSKVQNFLVKITIQIFLLQTSRNVLKHVIHKWGGHIWPFQDALRPQRFWNFAILSEKFLIFQKNKML